MAGTSRIKDDDGFTIDLANRRRNRHHIDVRSDTRHAIASPGPAYAAHQRSTSRRESSKCSRTGRPGVGWNAAYARAIRAPFRWRAAIQSSAATSDPAPEREFIE